MFTRTRTARETLALVALATLATACGEQTTTSGQSFDGDAVPGADATTADGDTREPGAIDASTAAPTPPPPPPSEPPETAQPPPIIGPTEHTTGTSVETLAGGAEPGLVDGLGSEARFNNPVGVTVAPDGTVYVADFQNDRIRRVTRDGVVTTLSDTPDVFQRPFGLTFDDAGDLYVQTDGDPFGSRDYYTSTIWRVDPDLGRPTVLVADIGRARGLAPLAGGGVLVTDNAWHSVRRLDTETGELSELAGSRLGQAGFANGRGSKALFFRPYGAAVLPNGEVAIADARNHCIRSLSMDGEVTTLAGTCGQRGYVDGAVADALFNFPQDLAVDDAGELFVTDVGNHCIRLVSPEGVVSTLAGDGVAGHRDGAGDVARFQGQEGLDVTPDGSLVYVADGDRSEGKKSHYLRVIRRPPTQ